MWPAVTVDAGRALPSARSNNFANTSGGCRGCGVAGGGALATAAAPGGRVAVAARAGVVAVAAGAGVGAVAAGVGVVVAATGAGVGLVAEVGIATAAGAHASPSVNSISYASPDATPLGPGSSRDSCDAAGFAATGGGCESGCDAVGANAAWGGWSGSEAGLLTPGKSGRSPAELSAVVFPHRHPLRVRRKTAAAIAIPAAMTTMTNST
jgi:hypothetical protein